MRLNAPHSLARFPLKLHSLLAASAPRCKPTRQSNMLQNGQLQLLTYNVPLDLFTSIFASRSPTRPITPVLNSLIPCSAIHPFRHVAGMLMTFDRPTDRKFSCLVGSSLSTNVSEQCCSRPRCAPVSVRHPKLSCADLVRSGLDEHRATRSP